MFNTLRTLIAGSGARAEARLRQVYAVELIDQKIREAGEGLKAAKLTLASLIQRERSEGRMTAALAERIADLTGRARAALADGAEDLATEAAEAIAEMENELALRRETLGRLAGRILRLRHSVEATNRRLIDLRQGAVAARAIHAEQALAGGAAAHGEAPIAEAEALIAQVLERDDPLETQEILGEIDRALDHADLPGRLADAGYGRPVRSTAKDVLARLRAG